MGTRTEGYESPEADEGDDLVWGFIAGLFIISSIGIVLLRMVLTSALVFFVTRLLIVQEGLRPTFWSCVLVGVLVELWYDPVRKMRRIPERIHEYVDNLSEDDFGPDEDDEVTISLEEPAK